MKMLIIYILSITLLFQYSSCVRPAPKKVYNHLHFIQTWTPTVCSPVGRMACISPLPQYYSNNFSMHGLWPAMISGATLPVPSHKTTPPISDEVFEKVEERMDIWWAVIDRKCSPKIEFWENEWIKHGQMGLWGEGDDGAEAYFLDGIKARQGMNLLLIMQKGGIRFNTDYSKQDIVNAVRGQLRVKNVYISCKNKGQSFYLYEVYICMDKNTHQLITCPNDNSTRGCTGTHFQMPVFH